MTTEALILLLVTEKYTKNCVINYPFSQLCTIAKKHHVRKKNQAVRI